MPGNLSDLAAKFEKAAREAFAGCPLYQRLSAALAQDPAVLAVATWGTPGSFVGPRVSATFIRTRAERSSAMRLLVCTVLPASVAPVIRVTPIPRVVKSLL